MTNDALNTLDEIFFENNGNKEYWPPETVKLYETIQAALAKTGDVEGLKREADAAYCNALDLAERNCRGSQYKLENGKFTSDDLKWHCQHNERIGYHRGMHRVLKEIDRIAAQGLVGVPDGCAFVPIEPTGAMIMYGIHAHERNDDLPNIGTGPKCIGIYKAMISGAKNV